MTTLALENPLPMIAPSKEKTTRSAIRVQQSMAQTRTHEEISDEELIHAICQDEEWAMEMLYTRYHRYAYALAYRILRDSAASEDIVQEVFLSIWRKASSYQRQYGSVYSWLQAIVHHRTIDRVRSAGYREQQWRLAQEEHERERGHALEQEPASQQLDVWEEAWERERRTLIRRALAQLPIEQRHVIEQGYFEGYTHAEIAQSENIPLGTVKGRMRLGLQKMRLLLQEYGVEAAL
jgi:RNA polymerase sigma-70 factor (ECF subfamily)